MTVPICAVTGRIAGDSDACGDCDPCGAAHSVSDAVKRLLAEKDDWRAKYGEAMGHIDALKAERLILDRRIHNQRIMLRKNWEIIEQRAQYKRAWYPSELLRAILRNRRSYGTR